MFGAIPPPGLTKDIIARMIAYRIQEEAFGGLDPKSARLLDRMARGEKPSELPRRLKAGTVLIREYNGERHGGIRFGVGPLAYLLRNRFVIGEVVSDGKFFTKVNGVTVKFSMRRRRASASSTRRDSSRSATMS